MDAVAEEQAFVDDAYSLLDSHREHLLRRIASIADAPATGTGQDLLERQALYDSLAQQARSAEAAEKRLCFGRVDHEDGTVHRIGRIGLRTPDGEPVLLDWRAPNAAGFYQATTVDPMGLRRRRRIIMRDREVTHTEDEDLSDPTVIAVDAAARAVDAPREGRMGDIIATIAADQDRIVRSPLGQVTVVQGGPGTGKTVVALHRAAWLLYTHRERLARDGVLIVGPSTVFLRYIDQVLPSLGETDVVLLTPGQLYPGISTDITEPAEVAAIKGSLVMAKVVANAVRLRIRVPDHDVTIRLSDGSDVTITRAQLADARKGVPRNGTFHGNREPFLRRALDHLCRDRVRRRGEDPSDPDHRMAALSDLVEELAVRRTLNLMWLPISPERLITLLLTDAGFLAQAGEGLLTREQQSLLLRPTESPWTVDDAPLLDEAADRLGDFVRPTASIEREDPDYAELRVEDPFARNRPASTVAERALDDRTWVYAHVVVDEAQELSQMAWRALSRRCSRRSMTVVGDLQQAAHPAGARDWQEALGWVGERLDVHVLTVTYRITAQVAATATEWLLASGGDAPVLHPIREGEPTESLTIDGNGLQDVILDRVARQEGRAGVILPDNRFAELAPLLSDPRFAAGDDAVDAPIAVLRAGQTKGLEFDHVFVIDPESVAAQAPRGADIYVACTRATQTLHLITLT